VSLERTFAIIKPDAVKAGQQGENPFSHSQGRLQNRRQQIHASDQRRSRRLLCCPQRAPLFGELTDFMSSGKIFALVLEADGAILKWRDTMGATDPKKAAPGTIRHDLGTSIGNNLHAWFRRPPETAAFEIGYFFSGRELILTSTFFSALSS